MAKQGIRRESSKNNEKTTTLGSAAKHMDGRTIVNRYIFFVLPKQMKLNELTSRISD